MFMQAKLTDSNLKWKKLLNAVLSLVLVLAMLFTAGCTDNTPSDDDDDDDDDDIVATSITLPIKNGDFENSGSTTQYPQTVKDWTSSYTSFSGDTSSSTNTKAGVVNVTADEFEGITDGNLYITGSNDKDSISMPKADLNPGSLFTKVSNENNVLMIVNKTGNAYKYRSSSVTLPANGYAKITVYVNAFAIKSSTDSEGVVSYEKVNFEKGGAFVGVYGTETPAILKNISTVDADAVTADQIKAWAIEDLEKSQDSSYAYKEDMSTENRIKEINDTVIDSSDIPTGWKKYELYVEGSAASSNSIYLELGLGLGGSKNNSEYVKGYAFFDQVSVEYLSQAEYAEATSALSVQNGTVFEAMTTAQSNDPDYTAPQVWQCDATVTGTSAIAYTYKGEVDEDSDLQIYDPAAIAAEDGTLTIKEAEGSPRKGVSINTSVSAKVLDIKAEANKAFFESDRFLKEKTETVDVIDETTGLPKKDEDGNKETKTETRNVYPIENYPFANSNVYVLSNDSLSAFGTVLNTDGFKVEADKYYRVSVWLKSSDVKYGEISLNLLYGSQKAASKSAFGSIKTSSNDVSLDTLKLPTNGNLNDDWVEYSYYIKGGEVGEDTISLELWLGPRIAAGKAAEKFTEKNNYVMASGVMVDTITASEYNNATSGDQVKTAIDVTNYGTNSINGQFNKYNDNQELITDRVKTPSSWTYLTDEEQTPTVSDSVGGIFSVKDALNSGDDDYKTYLNEINESKDTVQTFLNFNSSTNRNALMLKNSTENESGFRSPSATLSADSYAMVTVRVRTVKGTVRLQLVDSDGNVLKVEGVKAIMKKDEDGKETDDVAYLEKYASGEMKKEGVTSESGWTTYTFLLKSGDDSLTFHLEMWLNGVASGNSYAYAFFDDVVMKTDLAKDAYNLFEETIPEGELEETVFDYSGLYSEPERNDDSDDDTADDDTADDDTADTTETGSFDWTALTMVLLAVALLFALGAVVYRKVKESKKFKKKAPKTGKASYHRDNVKYSSKKAAIEDKSEEETADETTEEPTEEVADETVAAPAEESTTETEETAEEAEASAESSDDQTNN